LEADVDHGDNFTTTLRPPSKGDRDTLLEGLFRDHYPAMVRVAYCLIGDRAASEDAAQEAFASLHRHWDGVRDSGALVAYLRRATINQCRTGQRRLIRGRGALARMPRPARAPSSEDSAIAHDEYHRLASAIGELPTRQREVLVCRYLLDMTEAETAQALEIGVGSVKQHAHRARTTLHELMGEVR
jgi:RNA polymerase sigma-70 factor (sigma-E family)